MIVSGLNDFSQISFKSNCTNAVNKLPLVCPPLENPLDITQLQSYSTYYTHSIIVKNDGKAYVIGSNGRSCLFSGLPKKMTDWTQINMNESEFISVACGNCYALCLLKPNSNFKSPHLYCFWNELFEGAPIFIDIGDRVPIGLFGGRKTAAAIDSQGDVIVISPSVFTNAEHKADIISLPNKEKSIYVACLEKMLFILSDHKKVYEYALNNSEGELKEVLELMNKEIISLSGTWHHVLAVSSKNEVFGRGSNDNGQLCINFKQSYPYLFQLIDSLNGKNIVSAFAGSYHSLFIDSEGKVYSCGQNQKGELLSEKTPSRKIYDYPLETTATGLENMKAKYCIAGCQISCAFISNNPPPKTPNQIITDFGKTEPKVDNIHKKLKITSESSIKESATLNPYPNPKIPSKSVIPSSEPTKLHFRQQIKAKARNKSIFYNIEKLEEIQEVRSQLSQMRKQSQEITLQISEMQKEKNAMMHNLRKIGTIIEQIIALRNNPKIHDESTSKNYNKPNSYNNMETNKPQIQINKPNSYNGNETNRHQIQISKPTKNHNNGSNSNEKKNNILIQFKDNKQPPKNITNSTETPKETQISPQKELKTQIELKQQKSDIQIILPQPKSPESTTNDKNSTRPNTNINTNSGVLITKNNQSNKVQIVKNDRSNKPQSYSFYTKKAEQHSPISLNPSIHIEKKSSANLSLKPVQVVKNQKTNEIKIDIKTKKSDNQNNDTSNDKNIKKDDITFEEPIDNDYDDDNDDDDDDDDEYDNNVEDFDDDD